MNFKTGMVVGVANNFVEVRIRQKVHRCLIKGNIKFKTNKILVGDQVNVNFTDEDYPVVIVILPRNNELYRPRMANVDQVLIVTSLVSPPLNSFLLNKLLTTFNFYHLEIILVFTKIDLVAKNHAVLIKIAPYEALNLKTVFISNVTQQGIDELKQLFANKLSLLTGTSGVGKSSTLNSLNPDLKLWTQNISSSLNRGKHTTTKTRLYFLFDGIIADTPGFLNYQLQGLTKTDIATNFPSFNNIWQNCKFRTCLHQQEPQCAIKTAVVNKIIINFFYEDYCKILTEFSKNNK